MFYCYLETPVGELILAGDEDVLRMVEFPVGAVSREPAPDWIYSEKPFGNALRQLSEYFAGELTSFKLNLQPGGTPFQLQVLAELQKIPYGTTTSYGEIARRIGRPKAVRAVGAANGRNPIPIIIPCHRVIGSNGSLTGFGGGLAVKQALLRLELEYSQFPHTA
jgi:methylated-DNA-[protein]-cysteine S-methyltransferase